MDGTTCTSASADVDGGDESLGPDRAGRDRRRAYGSIPPTRFATAGFPDELLRDGPA